MKLIRCFLFSIIFVGCQQHGYEPITKQELVNEVIEKTAKQLKSEYGLSPFGRGGRMMHQIEMLALSLTCPKELSIEEGRKLLIVSVSEFINTINSNDQIQPYLKHAPFGPKNVEIRIFIRNSDGSNLENEKMCVISAINGILEYEIRSKDGNRLITIHKETYEEAAQKLAD